MNTNILNKIETDEIYEIDGGEIDRGETEIDGGEIEIDGGETQDDEMTSSQVVLIDYLTGVDNNIEYIHIDKKIYGILDFSILDINHHNINHIFLGEGNITEIINLPQSLKKLECSNN